MHMGPSFLTQPDPNHGLTRPVYVDLWVEHIHNTLLACRIQHDVMHATKIVIIHHGGALPKLIEQQELNKLELRVELMNKLRFNALWPILDQF